MSTKEGLAFAFLGLVLHNKEIKFKDSYPRVSNLGDPSRRLKSTHCFHS
jgi:hypothetical protein